MFSTSLLSSYLKIICSSLVVIINIKERYASKSTNDQEGYHRGIACEHLQYAPQVRPQDQEHRHQGPQVQQALLLAPAILWESHYNVDPKSKEGEVDSFLPQEQEWKLPEKQELEEEESCQEVNGVHLHLCQEQTSYQ